MIASEPIYDMHGQQIHAHDLVRVKHYQTKCGRGWRQHWMYKTVTTKPFAPDRAAQWYFLHWGPVGPPNQYGQIESDGYYASPSQVENGRLADTEVVSSPTSLNLWLKNRGKMPRSER